MLLIVRNKNGFEEGTGSLPSGGFTKRPARPRTTGKKDRKKFIISTKENLFHVFLKVFWRCADNFCQQIPFQYTRSWQNEFAIGIF